MTDLGLSYPFYLVRQAWMLVCTFMPPFFFLVLGCLPTPLNMRLEKRLIVVESIICRRVSHEGTCRFRLSEESSSLYRVYRLRYVASNTALDLRALASDYVLRLGMVLMPRWASLRASGNMESVTSRNESNLLMTA